MTVTKNVSLNAKIKVTEGIAVTVLIDTNPSLNCQPLSFVNLKSELTARKEDFEAKGMNCYRTRLNCNCKPYFNLRDGVLVINPSGQVITSVIRCKACTNQHKGGN